LNIEDFLRSLSLSVSLHFQITLYLPAVKNFCQQMKTGMACLAGWLLMLLAPGAAAQEQASNVQLVGQMKDVMWKGKLQGLISLDTLSGRKHLYGLGPLEYLTGELLLLDGRVFQSTIGPDGNMKMTEGPAAKAPFFGYASIRSWKEQSLPDSIRTLPQLEKYLGSLLPQTGEPFFFRLIGTVAEASIHVVNLPRGTVVQSPEDAHQGQKNFRLKKETVEILGFFSTKHQAIFTHHDTFLHLHLITANRKKMGHLDRVRLERMRLYLPEMAQ
jgi:acetolactate decarboxylase